MAVPAAEAPPADIAVVIPDAGPWITLADALELLALEGWPGGMGERRDLKKHRSLLHFLANRHWDTFLPMIESLGHFCAFAGEEDHRVHRSPSSWPTGNAWLNRR